MELPTLLENGVLYKQLFELNQTVMLLIDPDSGMILDANPAAAEFYGYPRKMLCTFPFSKINTVDPETLKLRLAKTKEEGRGVLHLQHRLASGDVRDVEVHFSVGQSGGHVFLCSIVSDITERARTETALRQSEQHLRALIASMDDLVFSLDLNGRFLFYHEGSSSIDETPVVGPDPRIGKRFQDVLPAPVIQRFATAVAQVTTTLDTQQIDYSLTVNNELRYFSARLSPLIGAGINLLGVTVVVRDVTETVRARQRQQWLFDVEQLHRHISALFWNAQETDSAIKRSLALAGQFFDVSRAFVVLLRDGERQLELTHTWCAPGVPPNAEALDAVSSEQLLPKLIALLKRDGLIATQNVADLPAEYADLLVKLEIQAVLVVPLHVDRRLYGFVGFSERRSPRQWLHEEITTVRAIAENYSRALERSRAQTALIQARDTALRSARLKSEFMSNMSHEVRTPMTGIIGMLELLLETELNAEQQGFAQSAYSSAFSLLQILDDILDFSKIEAGKIVLEMKPFDVRHLVDEVITTLRPQAARKHLLLLTETDEAVPFQVHGDATRLRQILMNLVSNAIKFSPDGRVQVRVDNTGNPYGQVQLTFTVSDTGIGIPLEQQVRIFDSFVQADGSMTRRYGGSGLGLSICKQLVQLMGGHIGVESTPGQGSTFTFTLTFPIVGEKETHLPLASSPNVLVVDADPTERYILAQQFRQWGANVREVNRLEQAPEALHAASAGLTPISALFYRGKPPIADQERLVSAMRVRMPDLMPLCIYLTDQNVTLTPGGFDLPMHYPISLAELYELWNNLGVLVGDRTADKPVEPSATYILLADDNATSQWVVARVLRQVGYRVDVASNGYEVLRLLNDHDYDLILMDVHMPEMDGLTATRHIRAMDGPKATIPVVALTASVMPDEQQLYLEAGVNAVWGKPFSLDQLRASVREWAAHK